MKQPLYLHFFDRELQASLGCTFPSESIEKILKIALMSPAPKCYCGISLLFETYSQLNEHFGLIIQLSSSGHIDFVNHHPTMPEFFETRKQLYAHDATRYPMYFSDSAQEIVESDKINTLYKPTSTTEHLVHIIEYSLEAEMQENLLNERGKNKEVMLAFKKGLNKRKKEAITAPLFLQHLKSQNALNEYFIRKQISEYFTNHYMEFFNGDIITGIPGFEYFDFLSKTFPQYDYYILQKIFHLFVPVIYNEKIASKLFSEFLSIKTEPQYEKLLNEIIMIVNTVNTIQQLSPLPQRAYIISFLHEISKTYVPPSFTNILEYFHRSYFQIKDMQDEYFKKNAFFKETFNLLSKGNIMKSKLLLCTANEIETDSVLAYARKLGFNPQIIFGTNVTYYVLSNSLNYELLLIKTGMGSSGPSGAALSITDAIKELNIDCLLSVGIAFGTKEEKQKIGDILVARQVSCYESQRVMDNKTIPRGDRISCSSQIISACEHYSHIWKKSKVHTGLILSGDKLVDSAKFKKKLLAIEPEAIGGEMEGAGISSACHRNSIPWSLVKSICDWGEKKDKKHQDIAAKNAVDFVFSMINAGAIRKFIQKSN